MTMSNYNIDAPYTYLNADDLNNYLAKEITNENGWKVVKEWVERHSCCKDEMSITQFQLYLILKQKKVPVPTQIITTILNAYPGLCNPSNQIYHLNVIVAFENPSSLSKTLYQLIHQSTNPIKLTYMVLQQMIHRSSNANHDNHHFLNVFNLIPEENLQILTHETLLEALYLQDDHGNLLLHQACMACNSPRMLRLLIDGMLYDIGWWCVIGCNDYGLSPFQLALASSSNEGALGILSELLSVIPVSDLPDRDCIVRNNILYVSIRVGNLNLAFKILKEYPDLLTMWNSYGSLPIHDVCQFGSALGIEQFLSLFFDKVKPQMNISTVISTVAHTRFNPIQIASMNPNITVNLYIKLLKCLVDIMFQGLEKRSRELDKGLEVAVKYFGLLHLAAAASNIDIARYLVLICPDALSYRYSKPFGTFGRTEEPIPLFFACTSGSSEMIEFLYFAGRHYIDLSDHAGLIDIYSGTNLHPIIAACSNDRITTDTMELLLKHSNIPSQWVREWRLFHCAAFEGNMEMAVALVSWYPEVLYHVDEDGNSPLHDACLGADPNMIEFIFIERMKVVNGYIVLDNDLFGIFQRNCKGVTPWDLVCEILESLFEENRDIYNHFSGLLSVLLLVLTLDAAMTYYKIDIEGSSNESILMPLSHLNGFLNSSTHHNFFPAYHSAIERISSTLVLECILIQNLLKTHALQVDELGRTALHLVAEVQKENEEWCEVIYLLLNDEEIGNKQCACIQQNNGRYVLHIAAETGLGWANGLEYIVDANEAALEYRDDVTGLFPFMLAAAGEKSDLDSIFELLRRNPGPLPLLPN